MNAHGTVSTSVVGLPLATSAPASDARLLSGLLVLRATGCWYPPAVSPNDILEVDFDCRAVDGDGLYLIEELSVRGVEWRGCRRFSRSPGGLEMDYTGRGDWREIDLGRARMRVVGKVKGIYKGAAVF